MKKVRWGNTREGQRQGALLGYLRGEEQTMETNYNVRRYGYIVKDYVVRVFRTCRHGSRCYLGRLQTLDKAPYNVLHMDRHCLENVWYFAPMIFASKRPLLLPNSSPRPTFEPESDRTTCTRYTQGRDLAFHYPASSPLVNIPLQDARATWVAFPARHLDGVKLTGDWGLHYTYTSRAPTRGSGGYIQHNNYPLTDKDKDTTPLPVLSRREPVQGETHKSSHSFR
ncbi:hypothetical protein SODALDRAFT_78711 [Sodiomyces alkalinus F11]|uniref:Uncharacterized protein n=1 Tax=Sodiomyces alkalinus (strain CBS 110278 / VKM F-3762 / F11) TaxID=1314773 RepID=A0A3N2PKX7_SODAK|nr:hypothetical protein SODALDRAFT_78711 [Sodiomyces alkalinus F11]ROT35172.1 hypothetical protein SODALDRAFT_78711 [Sodiomyces alkalinus F11]